MEPDAIGAAATAGLVAAALERPTGHGGEPHGVCSDCGAAVSGRFCQDCGQPTHVHRTLLHLGEELLHGVMHFDSRIWRTLPLLVINPGKLTREWVHGRRTRYVSPLAMFLFTIFIMFMLLSFMPVKAELPLDAPIQKTAMAKRLAALSPFPVTHPVEANAVFVAMDDATLKRLHKSGWFAYRFLDGSVRFMCSWATRPESVDELGAVLASLA